MSTTTTTNNRIVLIDATSDSLTVSWAATPNAERYILQYRHSKSKQDFETLSDKLTTPQVRKRNLVAVNNDGDDDDNNDGFIFRAAALFSDSSTGTENQTTWITHTEPFRLLSSAEERQRCQAPQAFLGGSNATLRVTWEAATATPDASTYELQMRENTPGMDWTTVAASLKDTQVRKKNLTAPNGYQFRVRLAGSGTAFSPPSNPVTALGLSSGLLRLFAALPDGTLIRSNGTVVSLGDALGGKEFVLLYASAHWCGPCRQFTPMLTKWYQQLGPNSTVEVVFLSADHDNKGFHSYFQTMPWLAVDYDKDERAREQLMSHIRVSGIPRLAVLDGRTGRIIEDNAVGKPLDVNRWRNLVK